MAPLRKQRIETYVSSSTSGMVQPVEGLQLTPELLAIVIEHLITSQPECAQIIDRWSSDDFDAFRSLPPNTIKQLQTLTRVSRAFYLAVSPYIWRTVETERDRSNDVQTFKAKLEQFFSFSHRVARYVFCISFAFPHYSDNTHHRTLASCYTTIHKILVQMPKLRLMQIQGSHSQMDRLLEGVPDNIAQQLHVFNLTDLGEMHGSTDLVNTKFIYSFFGKMTDVRHISMNSLLDNNHESDVYWRNLLVPRTRPYELIINNALSLDSPLTNLPASPLRSLQLDYSVRNGDMSCLFNLLPLVKDTIEIIRLDGFSLYPAPPAKATALPKLQEVRLSNIYFPFALLRAMLSDWHPKKLVLGRIIDVDGHALQDYFKDREGLANDLTHLELSRFAGQMFEDEDDLLNLVDVCTNMRMQVDFQKALENIIEEANEDHVALSDVSTATFVLDSDGYQSFSDNDGE